MPDRASAVSRRALLTAAAGGATVMATGSVPLAGPDAGYGGLVPVSMATHIHGPFSEGPASYEAHLAQAREHDVDVVWWTDHDFRVAAHDHRQAVHFDGPSEPEKGLSWTWTALTEGELKASAAAFVASPSSSRDTGRRALRLTAMGGSAAGTFWQVGTAWNATASTCVADTALEIDVLPEQAGPDAVLAIALDLSFHPARGGRPAGVYQLRYRIGGVTQTRHTAEGLVGTVELAAAGGAWKQFRLVPVDDLRRLWPDLIAEDNSLTGLRIGVTAGRSVPVSFVVDRLVFTRSRRQGQAGEILRHEVIGKYRTEYPDVINYPAYEVSLVRHLNWYGGDGTLPPFPSPPKRDDDPALTASMVDFLHAHGGIVCWNHPMDVEKRESLAKLMIERDKLGVDLVEIGRDPQSDLLWVFDVAARNALFFTAIGSSDDHEGRRWLKIAERYLTYVWAESTGRNDLVKALKKGSAWFTDPARYRGTMDIRLGGTTAMGAVVVTTASKVPVQLIATGLPAGSMLEIITGVADLAGVGKLAPSTRTKAVPAKSMKNGKYDLIISPGTGTYIRTQIRTAEKTLAAVSNPLWFLPRRPPRGIPADRERALPT